MGRTVGRLFRERQIYHRSEGVVRFIKLSARTQMAMALVMGAALLWVAYASVNVVFKEQIIVSKEQQRRDQEAAYRRRLQVAEQAYDQVNTLNFIYAREFDATISSLNSQHEALRALVENKAALDNRVNALAETLSATGAPGGRKSDNVNRLMIDPVGREPTPRQSRISALREDALRSVVERRIAEGIEDGVLAKMRSDTAELSARQVVLLASLEEEMRHNIRETSRILDHTGVDLSWMVDRHQALPIADASATTDIDDAALTGQGGPFIPVSGHGEATDPAGVAYFRSAARAASILEELADLNTALQSVPISSPIAVRHRMTSRFGWRWDPVKRNTRAAHRGLDFAAPRNSPIIATGSGRVSFAGVRGGFGRTVEIDHGNGFKTRYAHLNQISVRAGQRVELHDVIGLLGSTGRSTGNHVHYEVHYRGRQVDPLKFIEAGRYVFES